MKERPCVDTRHLDKWCKLHILVLLLISCYNIYIFFLYVWSANESLCSGKLCRPHSVCQVVAWQDLRE